MKLRDIILVLALVLGSLAATAQTYRDFVDFNDEMSQGFLETCAEETLGMELLEWGWLRNGQLTDVHDWKGRGQKWLLTEKGMLHFNTDDGSFIYDTHIADGRVYLKNQRKLRDDNPEQFITINPDYNGWLKILGLNKNYEILTIDNFGVYRIFSFFKI